MPSACRKVYSKRSQKFYKALRDKSPTSPPHIENMVQNHACSCPRITPQESEDYTRAPPPLEAVPYHLTQAETCLLSRVLGVVWGFPVHAHTCSGPLTIKVVNDMKMTESFVKPLHVGRGDPSDGKCTALLKAKKKMAVNS